MSNNPAPPSPNSPLQIGSSVVPLYVDRRLKMFLVTESEFETLSNLNGQTTTFSAVGTAILGAALSVWINALFYTEVPAAAYVAKVMVAPAATLLAFVFFWLAYQSRNSRIVTWNNIKSESASRASA
jgi:hypothetical protein